MEEDFEEVVEELEEEVLKENEDDNEPSAKRLKSEGGEGEAASAAAAAQTKTVKKGGRSQGSGHYTCHTEGDKMYYTCNICDHRSIYGSGIRDHINAEHLRIMLKCTHCPYETLRYKSLNFHRRKAHNLSAMNCPLKGETGCNYKSIQIPKLRDHLVSKHKMDREAAKECIAKNMIGGGSSGGGGDSSSNKTALMNNCDLDEELTPGHVGKPKRMRAPYGLHLHGTSGFVPRKTDEERQYKIILDESGKSSHAQCLYCDYTTKHGANVIGHMNAKHLGKQIKCSECAFSTFYPKNMATHVKKLHGRNTRKCILAPNGCKFRCIEDENMHIHLMEKHGAQYDEVKNAIYLDI